MATAQRQWKLGSVIAALALATTVACSPEIGSDTYFCGPEGLCPPDLRCDDNTFTCRTPILFTPFECPAESEVAEPDNDQASAFDLGVLGCGDVIMQDAPGCAPDPSDVDLIRFEYLDNCNGPDPRIVINSRFPIAHVPLTLEVIDDTGAVVATGEPCTPRDNFSGRDTLCIEDRPPAGVYFIRIQTDAAGPDCGGECAFNQYLINVSVPLS